MAIFSIFDGACRRQSIYIVCGRRSSLPLSLALFCFLVVFTVNFIINVGRFHLPFELGIDVIHLRHLRGTHTDHIGSRIESCPAIFFGSNETHWNYITLLLGFDHQWNDVCTFEEWVAAFSFDTQKELEKINMNVWWFICGQNICFVERRDAHSKARARLFSSDLIRKAFSDSV